MFNEISAKRFLIAFYSFLAINVAWNTFSIASEANEAAIARAVISIAIYGTFAYFLWKRSDGVRVFMGIVQVAGPIIFLMAEVLGSYSMNASTHLRMGGGIVFGLALLFWKPIRDYTKRKKPNKS